MILVGSVALWAHVDCGVIETRPTLGAATSRQQGNTLPSTSGINHYNRGRSSSDHLLRQSSTADGLSAIPLALCKQVPGSGFYYRIMTRQFYFQNKSNDSVGSNRINDFSLPCKGGNLSFTWLLHTGRVTGTDEPCKSGRYGIIQLTLLH